MNQYLIVRSMSACSYCAISPGAAAQSNKVPLQLPFSYATYLNTMISSSISSPLIIQRKCRQQQWRNGEQATHVSTVAASQDLSKHRHGKEATCPGTTPSAAKMTRLFAPRMEQIAVVYLLVSEVDSTDCDQSAAMFQPSRLNMLSCNRTGMELSGF